MNRYGTDGLCKVCGMLEGDHEPGNASCVNFPPKLPDGYEDTNQYLRNMVDSMGEQRWPDPISANEHEAFARLCSKNFAVIDALFGKQLEVVYDGERMVTPNPCPSGPE
jgi:hypothetical protein